MIEKFRKGIENCMSSEGNWEKFAQTIAIQRARLDTEVMMENGTNEATRNILGNCEYLKYPEPFPEYRYAVKLKEINRYRSDIKADPVA